LSHLDSHLVTDKQETPSGDAQVRWFAVYTRSHHEKSVARRLEDSGIDHFLPLYKSRRSWSCNRSADVDLPLFPNYIFVRIAPSARSRTLATPGVLRILRSGTSAGTLDDHEILQLRRYADLGSFKPDSSVSEGSLVRITSGPLVGLVGTVVWRSDSARVVLTISSIGQGASVGVSADQIAPVLKNERSICGSNERQQWVLHKAQ
jgi:transcription antitermination factor NusG